MISKVSAVKNNKMSASTKQIKARLGSVVALSESLRMDQNSSSFKKVISNIREIMLKTFTIENDTNVPDLVFGKRWLVFCKSVNKALPDIFSSEIPKQYLRAYVKYALTQMRCRIRKGQRSFRGMGTIPIASVSLESARKSSEPPDNSVAHFLSSQCVPPLLHLLPRLRRAGISTLEDTDAMRAWSREKANDFLRYADIGQGETIISDAFTAEVFLEALGL